MKTIKEAHDEEQCEAAFEDMRERCIGIVRNRIKEINKESSTPWYRKIMVFLSNK